MQPEELEEYNQLRKLNRVELRNLGKGVRFQELQQLRGTQLEEERKEKLRIQREEEKREFEKRKAAVLPLRDQFKQELAALLAKYNADISYGYDGDSHGITDEKMVISLDDVPLFEFTNPPVVTSCDLEKL